MNHDKQLELQVLSSAIHNKSALSLLMTYDNLFYDSGHSQIETVIRDLHTAGCAIDYSILYVELQQRGLFDKLKKVYASMAGAVVSPFFTAQLENLIDLSRKRKISELSERIYKQSLTRAANSQDLLTSMEELLTETRCQQMTNFHNLISLSAEELTNPEQCWPTGFSELDRKINGFYGGQFIIIGARTGRGKSALALQYAVNNARERKALLISLEMPVKQIILRKYTNLTAIPAWKIKSNKLTDAEREMISAARKSLEEIKNLNIVDSAHTLDAITNTIRRHHDLFGPALVIVDYIQQPKVNKVESRYLQIGEITRTLKLLAMELNIPIIGLSQLSRGDETQTPKLSDLRESGNIEQDSDMVLFINRNMGESKAELIIAKNRDGFTDVIDMYFDEKKIRFTEVNEF